MRGWQGQFAPMRAKKQEYWDNLLIPRGAISVTSTRAIQTSFSSNWVKSRRGEEVLWFPENILELATSRHLLTWLLKLLRDWTSSLTVIPFEVWHSEHLLNSNSTFIRYVSICTFLTNKSWKHLIFRNKFYPQQVGKWSLVFSISIDISLIEAINFDRFESFFSDIDGKNFLNFQ